MFYVFQFLSINQKLTNFNLLLNFISSLHIFIATYFILIRFLRATTCKFYQYVSFLFLMSSNELLNLGYEEGISSYDNP